MSKFYLGLSVGIILTSIALAVSVRARVDIPGLTVLDPENTGFETVVTGDSTIARRVFVHAVSLGGPKWNTEARVEIDRAIVFPKTMKGPIEIIVRELKD